MKRPTLAAVNAALRAAGIAAEIRSGNGYFYFRGPAVDAARTTMVMTPRLSTFTVEQWVDEARAIAADAAN